jgi:hypothetical protein
VTTANRPSWCRIDTEVFDNPKIMRAQKAGGDQAVMLWMRGLAYSTRHLTDGWVPEPLPKQWGYNGRQTKALEANALWIPLQITDDGGWLINNYAEYQVTREEWTATGAKRRAAAFARWQRK